MNIPKYVVDLMERSVYDYEATKSENYAAGYTIKIYKRSAQQLIPTHIAEIERLKKWVERQDGGEMHILRKPDKTTYRNQYVTVTIFDPVMKRLEPHIGVELDRQKRVKAARRELMR